VSSEPAYSLCSVRFALHGSAHCGSGTQHIECLMTPPREHPVPLLSRKDPTPWALCLTPHTLCPSHRGAAFRTIDLKARRPALVGLFFSTIGTNALPSWAETTAATHSSSATGKLLASSIARTFFSWCHSFSSFRVLMVTHVVARDE